MTYEEKKAWLNRYGSAILKYKYLKDALEEAESDTGSITQQMSGMPRGSGDGQALPRSVERVADAKAVLNAQIMLCDDLHAEILARMEDVNDPDDYEVLRLRYLRLKGWEQISEKMNICVRQVYRRHRRGVEELEL